MHRQCMPTSLSSTDYVRMKKDREVFNYKCVKCVGGIIVSAEHHEPVKRGRGRPRKHPLPATLPEPEPEVRPTFLAIAAASMPDTSSPMNIDGPGLLPFGVSPIDALPVTITVEARVAVTFTITPVGDASSRFEVPVPVSEDTVELLLHFYILISFAIGEDVKYATPCEVCKIVAGELEDRLKETGKSHENIETGYSIEAKKTKKKYIKSELRLVESLEGLCERILDYRMHKERTDTSRFSKEMSQTFKTLHGLVAKGVKVDLGIPHEMWDKPPAEVTHLKTQASIMSRVNVY
ncbi:hypothetical protein DAPPUDRAFT_227046 [Daphnia pulex]|uniref:DUF3456 domain-containing protein n=1 Tax=Daphnia pulex TaxID=6669 RepID=E9H3I3_DAPPU|nr:hypothetical protein DAPPUDRAFT_227046 [Daphnia pulex]|eukprot:EFX73777.1 hypothetical protein DAPPUDRAFT_227046 [Daphnia pulex]